MMISDSIVKCHNMPARWKCIDTCYFHSNHWTSVTEAVIILRLASIARTIFIPKHLFHHTPSERISPLYLCKKCIIVPIFIESGLQQLAQPWFWKLFNFVRNNSEGGNKMGQNFALFLNWMDGTLFCFPPWAWGFSKIFTIWVNEQTEMNKTSELCFSWMQRIHSQTYELIYLNSSMISNT